MRRLQCCGTCRNQIPLHAWVCPMCGSWVGEISRYDKGLHARGYQPRRRSATPDARRT